MRPTYLALVLALAAVTLWWAAASDAEDAPANNAKSKSAAQQPQRVLWTTSKVHGTPDPPNPYRVEVAFPKLAPLDQPLTLAFVPGTKRWAVSERLGKIFTFANDPAAKAELMLDVKRTVYGLCFHPKFAENGFVYVTSILDPAKEEPRGSRLSRYQVTNREPLRADADSEEVLLEWPSGGHNGGCIRFGPDGYLYLATGDGSGIADGLQTGQDLSDLLAAMLRIDVDHRDEGLKYAIPNDNPFVGKAGIRPEHWAYGLRQAWRFGFDPATGDLWAGEVGQDLWEEILLIEKGGNYGWSVMEATHPFRPERKVGPTPILRPVVEHHHDAFRSITGGFVYHGSRLPELRGAYIYGDYDTGKIWMLRYKNGKVTEQRELADTQLRIIDFGQDPAGELIVLDFMGRIYRLAPNPPSEKPLPPFPRKLSETGLFASTKDHRPAAGVIPYAVNSPLYADNAHKDRLMALPGNSQIEFEAVLYPSPAPGAQPGWRFPDGAVLVKTFSLEMVHGDPASRRRLETRLLHHEHIPGNEEVGAHVWHGYTYLWNDEQTDAELLDAAGIDREYSIRDPNVAGGVRKQTWHFPSRAECALCHTMAAKYVLGVNTLQMNRDFNGVNQLRMFDDLRLFTEPLPKPPAELPKLANYEDKQEDLDARARAYLHANCSHCHRKWGGGNAEFLLLASLPLAETGTLLGALGQGKFELDDPRLLVPGDPARSMILHRMQLTGLGRMPHIASKVVDAEGVSLIRAWIKEMNQTAN